MVSLTLPNKCEALSSNPSIDKKKKKQEQEAFQVSKNYF
jgi:hypothetical protein